MEILILGGILVALMVYVSTRIKRTAADAYEEEKVETDIFSITKPAGFIIIENEDPRVLFAAYSKEYGIDEADTVRQVAAELVVHRGLSLERVSVPIKETAERLIDERHLAGPSIVIETERLQDGTPVETEYHLTQKRGATYEFRVTVLPENREANEKEITTLLTSFELK